MSTATTQAEILSDLIDVSNEMNYGVVIYVFTHQGCEFLVQLKFIKSLALELVHFSFLFIKDNSL